MLRGTYCAHNVICWWLCRRWSIARKPHAHAAAPRSPHRGTRAAPTAYALVALFMLLLANLFPFVYMKVGGISSEIELLEIPNVLFSEDYASLGTFFLLFVQLVPAFCLVTILLLVNRVHMPSRLKAFLARILFHLKSWGWRRFSSPGCWSASLNSWPMVISALG